MISADLVAYLIGSLLILYGLINILFWRTMMKLFSGRGSLKYERPNPEKSMNHVSKPLNARTVYIIYGCVSIFVGLIFIFGGVFIIK